MSRNQQPPFDAALQRYRRARAIADREKGKKGFDRAVERVDDALDELMAAPSPSVLAFGEKMGALEAEYGLEAQPRHVVAIYSDAAELAPH